MAFTSHSVREAHIYHHRATDEANLATLPGLEDTKELLQWSETRQDEHKNKMLRMLQQGNWLKDILAQLGINKYTLAHWVDTDDRIAKAIDDWEKALTFIYEERFEDIFFHPERYDKALSRPAFFTFAISRLKAMSGRYKDNAQINIDNRSITVGADAAAGMVGKARDDTTVIEGVKRQLLKRARKPGQQPI